MQRKPGNVSGVRVFEPSEFFDGRELDCHAVADFLLELGMVKHWDAEQREMHICGVAHIYFSSMRNQPKTIKYLESLL